MDKATDFALIWLNPTFADAFDAECCEEEITKYLDNHLPSKELAEQIVDGSREMTDNPRSPYQRARYLNDAFVEMAPVEAVAFWLLRWLKDPSEFDQQCLRSEDAGIERAEAEQNMKEQLLTPGIHSELYPVLCRVYEADKNEALGDFITWYDIEVASEMRR